MAKNKQTEVNDAFAETVRSALKVQTDLAVEFSKQDISSGLPTELIDCLNKTFNTIIKAKQTSDQSKVAKSRIKEAKSRMATDEEILNNIQKQIKGMLRIEDARGTVQNALELLGIPWAEQLAKHLFPDKKVDVKTELLSLYNNRKKV